MKSLPLALLAVITGFRFWVAASLPVTPLEAYRWMSGHHLDWAFFDGPGATAALVALSTTSFGDGPIGIRFFFPLFAFGASFGAFLFGRALFGSAAGLWAAVAVNALPVFQDAAVHAGPEIPALALLLLAAWSFVRALDLGIAWWTGAGFFLMLAEQFQTSAILLAAGFVLVCTAPRRHRREWRRPGIYFALYLALTGLVPVILWNQGHDWPALATGTWRTAITFPWRDIPGRVAAAFVMLSPPAALILAGSLMALARDGRRHFRPRIVIGLVAPPAILAISFALHADPALTWTLVLVFALGVAAVAPAFLRTPSRRIFGAALLAATAGCTAFGGTFGLDPWARDARGVAWNEVANTMGPLLTKARPPGADPLFLIAPTPDATAALNYHLPGAGGRRFEVFLRESQDVSNQFGLWPRYDDFVVVDKPTDDFFKNEGNVRNPYLGRSALYLTDEEPADLPQTITGAFAAVTPYATLALPGGRKMRVYLCADYQTMPL